MLNNPAWSAYYLWKDGEVVPRSVALSQNHESPCEAPLTEVKGRSPAVLFSLRAGRRFRRTTASSTRA
jgi:hypothetical protein